MNHETTALRFEESQDKYVGNPTKTRGASCKAMAVGIYTRKHLTRSIDQRRISLMTVENLPRCHLFISKDSSSYIYLEM